MKNLRALLLFMCFSLDLHAQYTPFFTDQFDSNTNNWYVGKVKKSTVEFDHGDYSFYNDEGKSSIISLIDLPFDEKKNYRISSYAIERFIPSDEGMYGVMFAAKDEKNGYAVLLDQYGWCHVAKIEGGKIKELSKNSTSDENKDGGQISITLEDWRWQFKLGGKVMYTCNPLPWMGHKAGLYCGGEVSCSFADLIIEEATPSNLCPLSFKQETFSEQFGKIICSAPKSFSDITGDKVNSFAGDSIWSYPIVKIDGAKNQSIVRLAKETRQDVITFMCRDSMNFDQAERMFDEIAEAINNSHPSCYKLKQNPVKYNLSKEIQKDVQWIADKPSSWLISELVLNNTLDYYQVVIHVFAEK